MSKDYTIMVRSVDNKVGLQAYFYDKETSNYIGEAKAVKFINKDKDIHRPTHVQCELEILFKDNIYVQTVCI